VLAAAVGGAADGPLERVAVGVDEPGEEQRAAEVVEDRRGVVRTSGLGAHDRTGLVDLDVRRGDPGVVDEAVGREVADAVRGRGHLAGFAGVVATGVAVAAPAESRK
jgi:hypothetical protein